MQEFIALIQPCSQQECGSIQVAFVTQGISKAPSAWQQQQQKQSLQHSRLSAAG